MILIILKLNYTFHFQNVIILIKKIALHIRLYYYLLIIRSTNQNYLPLEVILNTLNFLDSINYSHNFH